MSRPPISSRSVFGIALVGLIAATGMRAAAPQAGGQGGAVVSSPQRIAEMQHHFTQVTLVYEAVVRGDISSVRAPALQLAALSMPAGLPAASAPFVAELRRGGRLAVNAASLAGVAAATVDMLTQCGACHAASGVRPAVATPPKPDVGGIVGHMLEHQRAANEMLLGLVLPSSAEWQHGAERLGAKPIGAREMPMDLRLKTDVTKADAAIHDVAKRALDARDVPTRSAVYVQLITSCAQCHRLHGKVWGPGSGL